MIGNKKVLITVTFFALIVASFLCAFWYMGGMSLFWVYKNYLSKDVPGKVYGYQDFQDRGPREMLHGYYAGADVSGFYMWTLSGLKRFTHKPDMSAYQYIDTCGLIRQLEEGTIDKNESGQNRLDESVSFDFDKWVASMKRGDYVWVKRVGGEDDKVIDKVLGNSSNTYPMTTISEQSCE